MPLIKLLKSDNQPDYNSIAIDLDSEGFDAFFLMFWLQGLREDAFWHFPEHEREYWEYTPAQREYLQKSNLLDEYARQVPEIYKLRADATSTGTYSGWDEDCRECDVQFCKVMDAALVWIRDQVQHLVALHQMDAPGRDLGKWACKEWLQYHLRQQHEAPEEERNGGQQRDDRGVDQPCESKRKPGSEQEADDAAPSP